MREGNFELELGHLGRVNNLIEMLNMFSNNLIEALKDEEAVDRILEEFGKIVDLYKDDEEGRRRYIDLFLLFLGKKIIESLKNSDELIKKVFENIWFEIFPVWWKIVKYLLKKNKEVRDEVLKLVKGSDIILEDLNSDNLDLLEEILNLANQYIEWNVNRDRFKEELNKILFIPDEEEYVIEP